MRKKKGGSHDDNRIYPGMKALGGGGGSYSKTSQKAAAKPVEKPKAKPKQLSHSQLQAQWEQNGRDADGKLIKHVVDTSKVWTKQDIDRARAAKEKAEEEARQMKNPKPVPAAEAGDAEIVVVAGRAAREVAKERMSELALALEPKQPSVGGSAGAGSSSSSSSGNSNSVEAIDADSLRSQLEELSVLEAMFVDDYRLLSEAAKVDALREALEALEADEADAGALSILASHSPLEFALQMAVEEPEDAATARAAAAAEKKAAEMKEPPENEEASEQSPRPLVASILLRVCLPRAYPAVGSPPLVHVEDAMIVEEGAELGSDKVVTSLSCAVLDEALYLKEMLAQAEASLPNPCVWELTTWTTEHVFEFINSTWL